MVTVVLPSPSFTAVVLAVSAMPVGAASSSVRVMLAEPIVVVPEVPVMLTVSLSSSQMLLVGVSVKVPWALKAPAAMLMVNPVTGLNLTRPACPVPATDTATALVTPNRVDPCTVAVTVTCGGTAFSATVTGETLRFTVVGVASSSVSEIVAEVTVTPVAGATVPETVIVSSVSSMMSLAGVRVNVCEPDAASAGMVTVKLDTGVKPTVAVPPDPATVTVTVCSAAKRDEPSTVAVTLTVCAPPSSVTVGLFTVSVTPVGTSSSSVTVTATLAMERLAV